MAFPTIHGAVTAESLFSTTQTFTNGLPASMQNGSLLVVFLSYGGSSAPTSGLSAYTLVRTVPITAGLAYVYAKVVDGTETRDLVLGTASNNKGVVLSFEVRGWRGDAIADDFVATHTLITGTTPNPFACPSLAAPWGTEDTLWLAAYTRDDIGTYTSFSNADFSFVAGITGASGSASTAVLSDGLASTPVSPGSFTYTTQGVGATMTLAIRPAASGSAAKFNYFQMLRQA